ncbi:hypothetical protein BDP27DRAFT_1434903 [Rhodocollybia butyracea]|uniref:Uncharacterized protein n=1 Tax=Rhodocollybia butyracea TaxID=206335 RepID=A0A9P5P5U5_9AGAR|nr:hypothetical protein BDP27DRAFT_1434903 [Rhodocollybia butyracea]
MNQEKTPLIPAPVDFVSAESLAAYQEQERRNRRAQRRKRIFTHIFTFFALFFGIRLLLHGAHHFEGYRNGHYPHHPYWSGSGWECADWPGEPNTQEVTVEHSFQLPISSDLLFLVARGPLANGQVNIVQSEDQSDHATVTVQTTYDEQHLLDLVKICSLVAEEGENGVGIFGALRPIQVDSLTAGSAYMTTANSPIKGNFTVHKSLTLSTANAAIDVVVTMLSEKAGETDLKMSTANSAVVSLVTKDSEESSSASVNGTFNIEANTAKAGVDIVMDPTYEGFFAVHSTPLDKETITAEDKEDPEGKDRKRNLVFNSVGGGNTKGNVYWGEGEGKDRGSIKVNPALGHVSMEL